MMKLLPKSEALKAQAVQKRQEQDEGMKLAQRVDGLRELKAKEEKSLSDFMDSSLREINKQISDAMAERDRILSEIRMIRAEKEEGVKEVKERQLDLDARSVILAVREENIVDRENKASEREKSINLSFKKAEKDKKIAETLRIEAEKLQSSAFEDAKEAKLSRMVTENMKEQVNLSEQRMKASLDARERILSRNELNLARKEAKNAEDRAQIERDFLKIKDRYAMLERDKQRI